MVMINGVELIYLVNKDSGEGTGDTYIVAAFDSKEKAEAWILEQPRNYDMDFEVWEVK